MKEVGSELRAQRKSMRLSVRKVVERSGVSAATIQRAENGDPRVLPETRSAIVQALASFAADAAKLRAGSGEAGSLADQIERHALELMAIVRRLRGKDGDESKVKKGSHVVRTEAGLAQE